MWKNIGGRNIDSRRAWTAARNSAACPSTVPAALVGRWQLSGNFLYQSGVAYGARGCHPNPGLPSCDYFYDDGELVARGSRGRSDDIYQLDLGLQFNLPLDFQEGHLYLRADVINVFNADIESGRFEDTVAGDGEPNLNYGYPSGFQQPRYVRISARLVF